MPAILLSTFPKFITSSCGKEPARLELPARLVPRISLFLLKINDALFPAPDRFPQVSFRLRLVSFGHDHHVLRTRNRACHGIAWPRDFMVGPTIVKRRFPPP